MNTFNGLPIIVSPLALTTEPAMAHSWNGRAETKAYHKRIQKKWNKRYGKITKPGAYEMADPSTGRRTMVMHPAIARKLIDARCHQPPIK